MGVDRRMILQKTVKIRIGSKNMRHYENLGYGKLKIGDELEIPIEQIMRNTSTKVLCECEDCGKRRMVSYDSLVNRENSSFNHSGETLCLTCANHRNRGEKNSQYKYGDSRYAEYRHNAARRGLVFTLTPSEFKNIVSQPCHYCGGYSSEYNPKSRGNGIDRRNNDVRYVIDNCVPCCWLCNSMKSSLHDNEFLQHIKRIYDRRVRDEIQK